MLPIFGMGANEQCDPEYPRRCVFYVSDGTGVTAQTLGHSLLTQFNRQSFKAARVLPFVDDENKARRAQAEINQSAEDDGVRPIVFSTLVNESLKVIVRDSDAFFLDLLGGFIGTLEKELQQTAGRVRGLAHGASDHDRYMSRIDAVNFALQHDDGLSADGYGRAELILLGVSRVGKTPTCLYLSMQHGLHVANYPFSVEEIQAQRLPPVLRPHRSKLFGLTIQPDRLSQIRSSRKPDSVYASVSQVRAELTGAESLMQVENIAYLDTTLLSIEEIAVIVLQRCGLITESFS
ncbi:MAG: pyruvate, water dikinase regulatory protein [Gammaproteobacteria bacterium]